MLDIELDVFTQQVCRQTRPLTLCVRSLGPGRSRRKAGFDARKVGVEVFEAELRQLRTRGDLTPADKVRSAWLFLSQWAVSDVEGTRTLRMLSQPAVKKQLTPEVTEATQRGIGMIRGGLAALIAEAVRTGQYREVDAEPTADMLWALFLGLLESNDVRLNLELAAPGFTESARSALSIFEGSLRLAPARIAEAA